MPSGQPPNPAPHGAPSSPYGPSLISAATLTDLATACAEAQASTDSAPPDARACAAEHLRRAQLARRAAAAANSGQLNEARDLMAAATAPLTSDKEVDHRVLFAGFQLLFRLGDHVSAEQLVLRRIAAVPKDSAAAARGWSNLGLIHWSMARMEQATEDFQQAIRIDEQIGDLTSLARDLGNSALVPESQGDLDAAESIYLRALRIAEEVGAENIIATKLANLGDIALQRGRVEEARSRWKRAVELLKRIGSLKFHADYAAKLAALPPPL